MDSADIRALLAEGRKHDEAMTESEWFDFPGRLGQPSFPRVLSDGEDGSMETILRVESWSKQRENAAGIAWMRNNLRAILDDYAAALDENKRLLATQDRLVARIAVTDAPADFDAFMAAHERLRVELGEAMLVIEQQDRDMARIRTALTEWRSDIGAACLDDGWIIEERIDAILSPTKET